MTIACDPGRMHRSDTQETVPAPRDWVYPDQREAPDELVVDLDPGPARDRRRRPKH